VKTGLALSLALFSFAGVLPSTALAQNQQPTSTFERRLDRPSPNSLNLPTSPILPMTNPIAPMTTAPVQPFIRYQGPAGTPTVVVPPSRTEDRGQDRRRGDGRGRRDDRDVPVVIAGPTLPYYYDPLYYPPQYVPAPVPGTLPGTYPVTPQPAPAVDVLQADDDSPLAPATTPVVLPSTFFPEPNIIITPQPEPLVVERPALGTARTDAVARYGEPWGSITMRGQETVYFRGGLVVVFENNRAVEVR
jgi:hypothetical protein